jgi:hypothetical protein
LFSLNSRFSAPEVLAITVAIALLDKLSPVVAKFGTELIDIRIKRIDLPQEVSNSVYQRMRAERERGRGSFVRKEPKPPSKSAPSEITLDDGCSKTGEDSQLAAY